MEDISAVLITGIMAILGTVTGSVIKGYWDNRRATKDFQSKLILKAMEANDSKTRAKSLEFLTKVNLIDDPKIKSGVKKILKTGELDLIPQFSAANITSTDRYGVTRMKSAKAQVLEKDGDKIDSESFLALTGFIVRSGDVVDGIQPIFGEFTKGANAFKAKHVGKHFGGQGGGETEVYHEGYIISGIDLIRGMYFGREEVIHFQLTFHRLTQSGIDYTDEIISPKLGSGNFAQFEDWIPSRVFRASEGCFISDFEAEQSYHSDGSTFLHDMRVREEKLG